MRRYLLLICILSFPFQFCLSQSLEEMWHLRFLPINCIDPTHCRVSIDSTQVTNDGFHPVRLMFYRKENPIEEVKIKKRSSSDTIKGGSSSKEMTLISTKPFENFSIEYLGEALSPGVRYFDWSEIVVLPTNAIKKGCTITLNCKSEVDSIRFFVKAFDKKENELYTDSVMISSSDRWTDYSLAFRRKKAQTVRIMIRYKGNAFANIGKSVYLSGIKISAGDRLLNDLPIDSLVRSKDTQLKTKAIIPLSYENDASLAKIHEWKDKKIIALGEQVDGIQDLRAIQIQLMRYLITSKNCKLILLGVPEDACVRWNLYLQGNQSNFTENQLNEELEGTLKNYKIFFEFLKWVRQYNAKADVPVRIIGIKRSYNFSNTYDPLRDIYMTDYLLRLSTTRQDSVYYLHAMHPNIHQDEYSQVKEHILQSEWSNTLRKKDFQYILFLMDELSRMHNRLYLIASEENSELDKAKRIEKVVDLYLSPNEKAVLMTSSDQINKREFIPPSWYSQSEALGSYLYKKYGKQYYAVSIQIGERTCPADTTFHYRKGVDWTRPVVNWPLVPFAFEQAAMNSENPYFYYSSDQLPKGILGLNHYESFHYCHIPSHFDALVFIREVKGSNNSRLSFPDKLWNLAKKVIGSHLDTLLK